MTPRGRLTLLFFPVNLRIFAAFLSTMTSLSPDEMRALVTHAASRALLNERATNCTCPAITREEDILRAYSIVRNLPNVGNVAVADARAGTMVVFALSRKKHEQLFTNLADWDEKIDGFITFMSDQATELAASINTKLRDACSRAQANDNRCRRARLQDYIAAIRESL